MLQQISNPLRIFHVRFPPRNRLEMLRIHQYDLEMSLQNVKNRFPIAARTFHRHMRYSLFSEPQTQLLELRGHGAKAPTLLLSVPLLIGGNGTCHHRALVDIQTRTSFIDHIHDAPLETFLDGDNGMPSWVRFSPTCFP